MTGFLSRSFENNWNIYKLLAHQKVSKEKVRWCEPQDPWVPVTSAATSSLSLGHHHCPPWGPPARGVGVCPGSGELRAPSCLG